MTLAINYRHFDVFLRLQNTKIFYEYLVKTQGHRNEKLGQKGWSYSAAKFTSWNKIVSPLEWQFGYSRLTLAINYWHFKTFLRLQNTKRQMGSTWSVSVIGALEHTLHNSQNHGLLKKWMEHSKLAISA